MVQVEETDIMEEKHLVSGSDATEKLYYHDSHGREFTATVLSCEEKVTAKGKKEGYRVVLDRTLFFPEGGGQFGDQGWIDGIKVTDTHEKNGVIYHETEAPIAVGTEVKGELDYKERFSRMQQHTGEHMLSGIIHRLYGYDNVGFHLGAAETTMDFNGELTSEQVREVETLANQAVWDNIPVEILYPTKEELASMDYRSKIEIEGQVRIVRIGDVDMCACCAPHVSRTGEVGIIKVISCDRHRGGCRMTIQCGDRALEDYRKKQEGVTAVSVALSAPPEKVGDAVLHMKEQMDQIRMKLNQMQASYLAGKLEEIKADDKFVCLFEEELDNIAVRNFVNDACERCQGICAAFVGTDEDGYRYIIGSSSTDVREFAKKLNEAFSGKGGGKPEMVQGSLKGSRSDIKKLFA